MSDDRLLATSYRYEDCNRSSKFLHEALAQQHARIQSDEKFARRTEVENLGASELERARWFNNLEEDSEKRQVKRKAELMYNEFKMANQELVKIRRAQLKKLLSEDNIQFEKELNAFGKAFYKKRM